MARPNNTNKRVFYATQAVAVGDNAATGIIDSWSNGSVIDGSGKVMIAHGIQSIGVSTNFNLEQIFELGQLAVYEFYEELPEIEITLEKVLDGYSLMYHCGTVGATSPTLVGRADAKADVRMAIGLDSNSYMTNGVNSGVAELYCSGMYITNVSYSLGTDGNFTESTTFIGNDKEWLLENDSDTNGLLLLDSNGTLAAAFASDVFGADTPAGAQNSVLRRQNVVIGSTGATYGTGVFKTQVPNILEGGSTGELPNSVYITESGGPYLQSFSMSVDLAREDINQLGVKSPYHRYVNFPVDVTCDLEVTATAGDNVDAVATGVSNGKNLSDHGIMIVLDDSTVFQLGRKNKLSSISYGGGDAGGGSATITYSFINSNEFAVLHSGDPINMTTNDYFIDHYTV
jgi:hypothetical protein